jgi:septum site-determining protein MinC
MNLTRAFPRSDDEPGPVLLRGTGRGLEIIIDPDAALDRIRAELSGRLETCPAFFAGSDVTIRCERPLPPGGLAMLDQVATEFGLHIAEVGPAPVRAASEPAIAPVAVAEPGPEPEPEPEIPVFEPAPRIMAGPLRSGSRIEAEDHLVVIGDVNPGAEVRAAGSVVVLGALRGVAHAGCAGRDAFILALRFAPQQLRIGELIARAGDNPEPAGGAEIAYATDGQIVVDRYLGKLPGALGARDL